MWSCLPGCLSGPVRTFSDINDGNSIHTDVKQNKIGLYLLEELKNREKLQEVLDQVLKCHHEVIALSPGSAFLCVGVILRQSVPVGWQWWSSRAPGLHPTHLTTVAEGEHLFSNSSAKSPGHVVVRRAEITSLELVGEKRSVLLELLGEWGRGGTRREHGQTGNPQCSAGRWTWRSCSHSKQTTGLFSKTLLFSWVCFLTHTSSQHFHGKDTHLPIDTTTLVILSVSCFG